MNKFFVIVFSFLSLSAMATPYVSYEQVQLRTRFNGKFTKCANRPDGLVDLTGPNQGPYLLGIGNYEHGPIVFWRCNPNRRSLTQTNLYWKP